MLVAKAQRSPLDYTVVRDLRQTGRDSAEKLPGRMDWCSLAFVALEKTGPGTAAGLAEDWVAQIHGKVAVMVLDTAVADGMTIASEA